MKANNQSNLGISIITLIIALLLLLMLLPSICKAQDIKADSAATLLHGKELPSPPPIEPMKWDSVTVESDSAYGTNSAGKKVLLIRTAKEIYWHSGKPYLEKHFIYNSNPGDKDFPRRWEPLEKIEYKCVK